MKLRGGADASGVTGLNSSTGEDEMLGVVEIVVDEICEIWNLLFCWVIGVIEAWNNIKAFYGWSSGNVNNVGEDWNDCESSGERWRGLSLRQYTPGKKIEWVVIRAFILWTGDGKELCDSLVTWEELWLDFWLVSAEWSCFAALVAMDCLESLLEWMLTIDWLVKLCNSKRGQD